MPTFDDDVGWVMLIRLQKNEAKTLGISQVTIKDCITHVADEVLRIREKDSDPTRYRDHMIEMV